MFHMPVLCMTSPPWSVGDTGSNQPLLTLELCCLSASMGLAVALKEIKCIYILKNSFGFLLWHHTLQHSVPFQWIDTDNYMCRFFCVFFFLGYSSHFQLKNAVNYFHYREVEQISFPHPLTHLTADLLYLLVDLIMNSSNWKYFSLRVKDQELNRT